MFDGRWSSFKFIDRRYDETEFRHWYATNRQRRDGRATAILNIRIGCRKEPKPKTSVLYEGLTKSGRAALLLALWLIGDRTTRRTTKSTIDGTRPLATSGCSSPWTDFVWNPILKKICGLDDNLFCIAKSSSYISTKSAEWCKLILKICKFMYFVRSIATKLEC